MPTKEIKDIRALMQAHARPQMVVRICLRGDLTKEIYRLDAELVALGTESHDTRLNGNVEAKRIAQQIKDLEAEGKDSTVEVTVQALSRGGWADLVAKHPAKDKSQDFDSSIYNDAVPACLVEPEMDAETRDKFLDCLTQGQWDELAAAVHSVNVGDGAVPFSVLASRALRGSEETSKPPAPGA